LAIRLLFLVAQTIWLCYYLPPKESGGENSFGVHKKRTDRSRGPPTDVACGRTKAAAQNKIMRPIKCSPHRGERVMREREQSARRMTHKVKANSAVGRMQA